MKSTIFWSLAQVSFVEIQPMFRRDISPSSSGLKVKTRNVPEYLSSAHVTRTRKLISVYMYDFGHKASWKESNWKMWSEYKSEVYSQEVDSICLDVTAIELSGSNENTCIQRWVIVRTVQLEPVAETIPYVCLLL
jgi:hypothetical protein